MTCRDQNSPSADVAYQAEVIQYFAEKADNYDLVEEQHYWRLSDALLWWMIEQDVLPQMPRCARALDAGGGTGRWSRKLLEARSDLSAVIYDLSPDMLRVAASKASVASLLGRLDICQGDLTNLRATHPPQYELVMCFHNVLGFVPDVDTVLRQLAEALKPGGHLLMVLPSKYHAAYFAIQNGNLDDAESAIYHGRGRFTPAMPVMHLFSESQLRNQLGRLDLHIVGMIGFPALVYPGRADTHLVGNSPTGHTLADPHYFARIFRLEQHLIETADDVAPRGNNLFVHATRPHSN